MPQQSLLPDYPAMTSLVLTIESFPHTKHADQVRVTVKVGTGGKSATTFDVKEFESLECDYLNTAASEVLSAYMYGERVKDVRRALTDVWRLARAHAGAHQF